MAARGLIQYVKEVAEEGLWKKDQGQHAKFTLGMLVDILARVEHTIETKAIETPPKLLHATVKVFASATASILMEMSKDGHEDECKQVAIDQFTHELNTAMSFYKDCLKQGNKPSWL